jgi:hypothetical protein
MKSDYLSFQVLPPVALMSQLRNMECIKYRQLTVVCSVCVAAALNSVVAGRLLSTSGMGCSLRHITGVKRNVAAKEQPPKLRRMKVECLSFGVQENQQDRLPVLQ